MGESQEGSHRARVQRFGKARTRTLRNKRHLDENLSNYPKNYQHQLKKARYGLRNCGNWLEFNHYYDIDQYRLVNANLCKNRWLCSLCGLRWADHALANYYARHQLVAAEYPHLESIFMTLTVKTGINLKSTYGKLEDGLKKLTYTMRQAKKRGDGGEFAKIRGMLGNVEIKKSKGKWHPHFHAMILADGLLDQPSLSREWHKKTGDSFIVDVRKPEDPFYGFLECMSYSLKSSTLTPAEQVEAYITLRGKQTMRATGLYRGVQDPEPGLDQPLDDLPYTRLLYRYLYGAQAYTLEAFERRDARSSELQFRGFGF